VRKFAVVISLIVVTLMVSGCGLMKETIKVGMDQSWPPFETFDSDGNPAGISIDIANELGKYLDVKIELVNLPFSELITSLENGDIDIILASMGITEQRKERINFSDPYNFFSMVTLVNKDFATSNNLTTAAELIKVANVTFVSPKGFSQIELVNNIANNPTIIEVNDPIACLLEVVSGNADAYVVDAATAGNFYMENIDTTVMLWDPLESSPIGVGVRKEDTDLLISINEFLAQLESSGFNDILKGKYDDVIAQNLPGQGYSFYLNQ